MKVAIMQPYLLPYIGYFQLMRAVDLYIFYDDAQFTKGGWINRNRIINAGRSHWITLPTRRDGLHTPINRRRYVLGEPVQHVCQQIAAAYARSAHFSDNAAYVLEPLEHADAQVAAFNAVSLRRIAAALEIHCAFRDASTIDVADGLRGAARVLALCRAVGASHYVNAIGGRALYRGADFREHGIGLSFLQTRTPAVDSADGPVQPSIAHHLLTRPLAELRRALDDYDELPAAD